MDCKRQLSVQWIGYPPTQLKKNRTIKRKETVFDFYSGFVVLQNYSTSVQKGKQKSPGSATSRSCSQPLIPGGRETVTQINVCIANNQMHDKHKDQLPLPKAMLKGQTKHIDKEQGKTKHEANLV